MKYSYKYLTLLLFVLLSVTACQKEVSLKAKGIDRGQGKVIDFNFETNVKVALVEQRRIDELQAQDPPKQPELNFGSMDVRYVTIDDVTYVVHWEDEQDFKNIRRGEKVNFRASDYIARVEKTGQNYKVIFLHEL